jgi:hypothetical protein
MRCFVRAEPSPISMRARRLAWIFCSLVTASFCSFVVADVARASSVAADQTPFQVYDHNIAGSYIGALNHRVQNEGVAVVVMAQEVCEGLPLDTMRSWSGFTVRTYLAASSNGHCENGNMYNVVATRSYVSGSTVSFTYESQTTWDTNRGERRGYVCLQGSFGKSWVACSTHLTGRAVDAPIARAQASEYLDISAYFTAQIPTFSGGDFNLRPPDLNLWYWYWHEGDGAHKRPTKPNSGIKIDYVFAGKNRVDALYGIAELVCGPPGTYSDHCFIRAAFLLP